MAEPDEAADLAKGIDEVARLLDPIKEKLSAGDYIAAQAYYEKAKDALEELVDGFGMLAAGHGRRVRKG